MKVVRVLIVIMSFLIVTGCGSDKLNVKPASDIPSQETNAQVPDGKYRVIFFNDAGFLNSMDGTSAIELTVNGKYYGRLAAKEYIQLFLGKGKFNINLVHYDLFKFETNHELMVNDHLYVETSASPISNTFEVMEAKPTGFDTKFKPVYWQ